jgi:hypothetical protein
MCWVRKKIDPKRLNMARVSVPLAAAKRASANRRRSSIGCFERSSHARRRPARRREAERRERRPAVHPAAGASMIA